MGHYTRIYKKRLPFLIKEEKTRKKNELKINKDNVGVGEVNVSW